MSEGGLFPWKLQKIKRFGPVADYSGLKNPLPPPPKGKVWHRDEKTREWSLKDEPQEPELEQERIVETLPPPPSEDSKNDDEWDLLSDKVSLGSVGGGGVFVNRTGSVCSVKSSSTNLSVPFKIGRTYSSSTIDSTDVGPVGVDYVEHVVLPTDTLQGLCLKYKVNATRIRQANHFSGNSLLLAPKILVIPMSKKAQRSGKLFIQEKDSHEFKLSAFRADCPEMTLAEAKAYLELNDWDLHDAVRSAQEDGEWEKEVVEQHAGTTDIRITLNCSKGGSMGITTVGAGIQPKSSHKPPRAPETVIYEGVPAIATKTVTPQDVYNAAPQHDNFGVELQPLVKESG